MSIAEVMKFENKSSVSEWLGKTVGILLGLLIFTGIAFFIISKARILCFSFKNYEYFAGGVVLIIAIIKGIMMWGEKRGNAVS